MALPMQLVLFGREVVTSVLFTRCAYQYYRIAWFFSPAATRPRHIEPEHLSPNLVLAHGCAQTIRHANFYPRCVRVQYSGVDVNDEKDRGLKSLCLLPSDRKSVV